MEDYDLGLCQGYARVSAISTSLRGCLKCTLQEVPEGGAEAKDEITLSWLFERSNIRGKLSHKGGSLIQGYFQKQTRSPLSTFKTGRREE